MTTKANTPIEKLVHTAADIHRMLAWFEREHGLSSEEFYELHVEGADLELPSFHRHVWASMYRDSLRLGRGGEFVARAEHTLAIA